MKISGLKVWLCWHERVCVCVRTVGTEDIFPVLSLIGTLGSHNNICFTFCTQKHKKCKLQEKCVCCTSGGVLGGGGVKKKSWNMANYTPLSGLTGLNWLAGTHARTRAHTHTHHGHSVTTVTLSPQTTPPSPGYLFRCWSSSQRSSLTAMDVLAAAPASH